MSDRFLFPATGFTKGDALRYYKAIAPHLLPHVKNRPVSFRRYVDTVDGESFWEKDAPSFTPRWVKTIPVPRREGGRPIHYIVPKDVRTLAWLVDVGMIELHPFLHTVRDVSVSTHTVFDLDPGEGAGFSECAEVASLLREALRAIELESFAKVSGSKGIQVYVPLNSGVTHEGVEQFAQTVANELARAYPDRIVAKMAKTLRRKKVFIDWSQNAGFKTTVAVYSLRAKRDEPYVSMPVTWNELHRSKSLEFTPETALARVKKRGDLFAPVLKLKQKLPGYRATRRFAGATRVLHAAEPTLPKAGSQSGRRLFLLVRTDLGNELWIEMRGKFRRWILRPDREGDGRLIAMPAGQFAIDPAYYRAEVPKEWKGRVAIEDSGAYEVIEGSWDRDRFDLWFNGGTLAGAWSLEKIEKDPKHKSWRLTPG